MIPITQTKVSNRVRQVRQAFGLSQIELASKARVSPATVVSIETKDGYEPRRSVMNRIAEALNVEVDNLFYYERAKAS